MDILVGTIMAELKCTISICGWYILICVKKNSYRFVLIFCSKRRYGLI